MDDGALVEAIKAGRTELFRELVDRHAAAVFRVVRAAVRQEADAEDLAQEIFLASFRHLERLREPARFRPWLITIAGRKATDYLRRRRKPVLSLDEEPVAPETRGAVSRLEAVEAVVNRLPEDSRLVFALRHHEGLSCKQIADMLDIKPGTVYTRLSRIHKVIRDVVGVVE